VNTIDIVATAANGERNQPVDFARFVAACRLFLHERYDETLALARDLIADACCAAPPGAGRQVGAGRPNGAGAGEPAAGGPHPAPLHAHHFDGTDDHSEHWITTLVTSEPRDGHVAGIRPTVRHTALLVLESLYLTRSYDACLTFADEIVAANWVSYDHPQLVITRAWVENRLGRYEEAVRLVKTVLARAREISPSTHATALHVLGIAEHEIGNIPVAHESLRDAVALHRAANNRAGLAEALNALGVVENSAFRLSEGRRALRESARLNKELGRRYRHSVNLSNLAITYYKLGYLERAHRTLDEAEALGDPGERVLERQLKRLARAKVLLLQERHEEARVIAEDVERIVRNRGYVRELSIALEVRGVAARQAGDLDLASRLFHEGLDVAEGFARYGDMVAGLQRRLGQIAMLRGETTVAEGRLRLGIRLAKRCHERHEEIVGTRVLAELYRAQHRYGIAYATIRAALTIGREFGAMLAYGWSLLEAARIQGAWFGAIGTDAAGLDEGRWDTLRSAAPVSVAPPAPRATGGPEAIDDTAEPIKGHLEAAWSYVVEALHLFERVGCGTGQHACERLMAELRDHWQPPWAASPAALQREQRESGFVARAPASIRVRRLLDLAAGSEDPVLLTGPTGTGKELAAQRIHALGKRAAGPLVAVNCGAIPALVFEREFFGHAKGAFTGAENGAPGFCERSAN
jgi:tetratricopeptide (TPR) repeat protein